ncbi:MAG: YitT family protein [Oscillospiraceae bacterium]|jgi:uncharacterized membrane-anchored protein YitT (DUF2179 family)|nr:YitT family protein [Oscillospiraceae bacterium]
MSRVDNTAVKSRSLFGDVVTDIVGCFVFSVGVQCFSAPNNIAPGGVSGIAILINYMFGLPISFLSLALNIPLLVMAWFFLGHVFTLRTLKTVIILTATLWICEQFLPVFRGEMILAALCSGVLEGIGLGLVFARGSTTGGTDVASRLIQIKLPNVSVGRLMLMVDGLVLLSSAIVYGHIENPLYGLIAIFTSTRIIDSILYGLDTGKVMMVVTKAHADISRAINEELGRGCTILPAKGSYTGEDRSVLFCAVRKTQFHAIKQLIYRIDAGAFVVALEANEVIGEGFKPPKEQK